MVTSWHLNEKSREVCIKARSTPASLVIVGQVTKFTTVERVILQQSYIQNVDQGRPVKVAYYSFDGL